MRLVSIVSFIFTLVLIYKWVLKETGDKYYSLISISLFSACFELSGAWYDTARADSLALLLLVLFFYIFKFGSFKYNQAIAALILTLACLCKQPNLVAAAPLLMIIALKDFKKYMQLSLVLFFSLIFAVSALNFGSDSLFAYYAYYLPSMHPIDKVYILGFWTRDLLPKIPFMIALSIFYLINLYLKKDDSFYFYASLSLGLVLSSWSARMHEGGYLNVLMPACAAFSLLTALSLKPVLESLKSFFKTGAEGIFLVSPIRVLIIVQFLFLLYNPALYIPSDKDLLEWNKLVDKISSFKGEVYIPYHPYLALMAHKKGPMAHYMAVFDILRSSDKGGKNYKIIDDAISAYISEKKAEVIILDSMNLWHMKLVRENYKFKSRVFEAENVYPVSGTKPEYIFVRK